MTKGGATKEIPALGGVKLSNARVLPWILFGTLTLVAVRAFAGTVSLAWDPIASSSLVGYLVYFGPSAGQYAGRIDVGNTTNLATSALVEGATYHFAVTTYDPKGTMGVFSSAFSNDVSATVPYSEPVAQFIGSTTFGVAPLAMNFVSTSTGAIDIFIWTFGDGTTSSAQNPAHVYSAAGNYTVSLTVVGAGGRNTLTQSNYMTVLHPRPGGVRLAPDQRTWRP